MAASNRGIEGSATWLHGLRTSWACAFTLAMMLNLNQFGAASGLSLQPKYWASATFIVSLVIFSPDLSLKKVINYPLTWWVGGFFLCSALWILWANDLESGMNGLSMAITTTLYVMTALLVYPATSKADTLWGVTLWLALLTAVSSVLLEYFMPNYFAFSAVGQGIAGRSAGLYLNPNIASQSILMILACLLLRNSSWTSILASLIAFPAVLLTFSRAGLLGWLFLVAVSAMRGQAPRLTLASLLGAIATIMFAGPMVLDAASSWIGPENRNSLDRLAWILGQGDLTDHSATEREWIAGFAWNEFLTSPLVGHGLGYMSVWDAGVGAHNMILRHIVEYGMLGFLIFPLFLCCSVWSADAMQSRRTLWSVAALAFMLGFFSHNMLEQGCFVFPWLACCLMSPSTGGLRMHSLQRGASLP